VEYETQSYESDQFQLLDSTFTGDYSDYGADTDGDGRYDYLVVEAEVNTIVPSSYDIIGRLYDDDGNEIAWAYNDNQLDAGTHFVPLMFDALAIFKHQVNGPYSLSISMFDKDGTKIDWQENAYTTASYTTTSTVY
jgi:hypothetical protein